MAIFNDLEQALGGPADRDNRFLNQTSGGGPGTSFPGNTGDGVPFRDRTSPARRERQGENAPTRKKRVIEGEKGAKEPRMLRESEKRGSRRSQDVGPQSTSGEGVKPLQQELRKYGKSELRKTLTSIQGSSSDAKVFGSSLTVGEARKVIRDELKRRQ